MALAGKTGDLSQDRDIRESAWHRRKGQLGSVGEQEDLTFRSTILGQSNFQFLGTASRAAGRVCGCGKEATEG